MVQINCELIMLCILQVVVLDMDVDPADLSVERVAALAAAGALTLKVNGGKPLTNAQIDLLIPSWQKANIDSEDEQQSSESKKYSATGSAKDSKQQRFRKRRDWDDEEGEGKAADPEERDYREVVRSYDVVRESMDEALSAVSDRERLTDDEMQEKVGNRTNDYKKFLSIFNICR